LGRLATQDDLIAAHQACRGYCLGFVEQLPGPGTYSPELPACSYRRSELSHHMRAVGIERGFEKHVFCPAVVLDDQGKPQGTARRHVLRSSSHPLTLKPQGHTGRNGTDQRHATYK
jgi:hypothetical protein